MKNIPRTAFLLVTSLYLFGNQIAHGATDASYIDPKDLKSTELICTMDTSDDYNGDNGFKKSENAGQYMSDNFDREVTTDRPNIFQSLLAGKSPDSNDMTTYISAIITIVVPCVLVAAFNLCNCICCICCRQCCHWCCKGKEKNPCRVCQCIPKTSHYSKEEQYMPVAVYACIGVTLFGFAIAGVTNGVHKFNDSLIEGICLSDTTYLRFSQFLRNVKSPLNTLETDFNVAVDKLSAAATIDKQLSQNVQDIATKMGELKTAAKNAKATIPTANPTLRAGCEAFWQEIIDGAKAAETETTTSANNLDSQLQSVQTEIDKSLVSGKDSAKASLKTAKETIDTMQSQLDVSLDPRAYNLMQLASDIKGQKDNSGFSSFGWVFVSLIFVTTSIFGVHECKHHTTLTSPPRDNPKMPLNVIKLNHTGECFARLAAVGWCCALFFGIFCGIFAAVMLPLSAVMTDVCVVLPTLPSQLGELSGSQDISNIVTTCWNSTGNLLDGLGLSSSIDVNAIDFDSFDENFGGDVTIDTTELEKMVKTLDSGDSSNCGDMTTVKTKTNAVITQSNFAATEFQESTIVFQLKEEGRKIIALLQKAIDDFKTATNCYFVKVIWDDVSNVVCVSLRDSIQWWGTAELYVGLFCLPYAITVLFMMKRYGGHGPIAAKGAEFVEGTKSLEVTDETVNGVEMVVGGGDSSVQQAFVDVLVPPGHGPGAFLITTDPNTGEELTVTVPEGVGEHQTFRVQLEVPSIDETIQGETEVVAEYVDNNSSAVEEKAVGQNTSSDYVEVLSTDDAVAAAIVEENDDGSSSSTI